MSYDPIEYQARRLRNERSREWADRDRAPWTPEDDEVIRTQWIDVDPYVRDEKKVSQKLHRTLEACRVRASYLRGNVRSWGVKRDDVTRHNKNHDELAEARRPVCPSCFMELPATLVCGTCE